MLIDKIDDPNFFCYWCPSQNCTNCGYIGSLGAKRKMLVLNHLENDNERLLYAYLKEHGPLNRGELVARTGIARTTVFDALGRLQLKHLVTSFEHKTTPGQGRKTRFWQVLE